MNRMLCQKRVHGLKQSMSQKRNFIAALRPEPDLTHRWGLRSVRDGRWLPVVYPSEKKANAAAEAMK